MSKAGHLYRRIERFAAREATSHAWICLLRLIEACARSAGRTHSAERAALERRVKLGARPELPAIVRAAQVLYAEHASRMELRAAWVAARRAEKRAGNRNATRQARLLAHEAGVAAVPVVRVGVWGWRRRAQDGSGPGVSGPLGGSSGLAV